MVVISVHSVTIYNRISSKVQKIEIYNFTVRTLKLFSVFRFFKNHPQGENMYKM